MRIQPLLRAPLAAEVARAAGVMLLLLYAAPPLFADITGTAGPYRVQMVTEPAVVPTGDANLFLRLLDSAGNPVLGARVQAIVQMPGMPMGEKLATAEPLAARPGVYSMAVHFAMAGAYKADIRVTGPQGEGTALLPVATGQDTGTLPSGSATTHSEHAFNWTDAAVWLGAALLGLFVLYRMRITGQRLNVRGLAAPSTIVGVLLLVVVFLAARWAVGRFTEPGHMSVIEAQSMDMTVMHPPVGAVPVAAMAAGYRPIDSSVEYQGTVAALDDSIVSARVAGAILWMGVYPGTQVHQGDVIARLDSRELQSRSAEQTQELAMQRATARSAEGMYQSALAGSAMNQAHTVETAAMLAGALADLQGAVLQAQAAQDDRDAAAADLSIAQTQVTDAQAQQQGADADVIYWTAQLARSAALLKSGAISRQEYQQDADQSANVASKRRQAAARVAQMEQAVASAQAKVARAVDMVKGAASTVRGKQAALQAAEAGVTHSHHSVDQAVAEAAAARATATAGSAGARLAAARLNTAQVVESYTAITAPVSGVVAQRLVSPGTLVQPGQAILRVVSIDTVRVQVQAAPEDSANIAVGSAVTVRMSGSGHTIAARVTSLFPSADPVARTVVIEALVPNRDHKLLPGAAVSMRITTAATRRALVVPASAVIQQPLATSDIAATGATSSLWIIENGVPEKTIYTCTMHPQIKQDGPGKCPI